MNPKSIFTIVIALLLFSFSTAQAGLAYFYWEAEIDNANTRLQKAAVDGDVSKMESLLSPNSAIDRLMSIGIDVNEHDRTVVTPLMFAARHDKLEAVRLLLRHNADPNITTSYGNNTALVFAAAHARPEIVQALLDAGADPSIQPDSTTMGNGDALAMALEAGKKENAEIIRKALSENRIVIREQLTYKEGLVRLMFENPGTDLDHLSIDQRNFLHTCNTKELQVIRNAIFARQNYAFDTDWLTQYYTKHFDVYKPVSKDIKLSDIDKKNINTLLALEKEKKRI